MENTGSTLRNSENIVQNAYDILRTEGYQLSADVSCVIPYLIVYLRAGYPINRFLSGEPLIPVEIPTQEIVNEFGYSSGLTQTSSTNEALHFLEVAISRLRQPALHRILDLLSTLRLPAKSQEDFRVIFDSALDYLFQAASRSLGGQHLMPPELVQFVAQAFQMHTGESIYNPFAGTCQLAGYLAAEVNLFGQEPDGFLQALAVLRLTAYRQHNAIVVTQDPLRHWPSNQLWDVILSTGLVFDSRLSVPSPDNGLPANARPDLVFVHHVFNSLREGGRAVIPVTSSFLWRNNQSQISFRQRLVESGFLDAVIEMPNGLLSGTGIGFSLLLIHNVPGRKAKSVRFLDADQHISGQRNRKILNSESLIQALHSQQENEHARFVAFDELAANDYNLSARRYLTPVQVHPDDVQLGKIAQPIRRPRPVSPVIGRFVNVRQLLGESPNYEPNWYSLQWSDFPLESIDRLAIPLTEDALLVAAQGSALKPTWFIYEPEANILLSNSVTALHLDLLRVDVEYLVTELNSDYVLLQLRALQTGSTVAALSRQDLLRLRIRLPKELSQQRAIVDGIREQLAKQKQKEANALRASRVQKAESFQQFAVLKHTLGRPLQNLVSGLALLEEVILGHAADNRVLTLNNRLNELRPTTVQNTFDALKESVQYIFTTLDRNDHELSLESFPKEQIEIIGYLARYCDSANSINQGFTVSFALDEPDLFDYYYPGEDAPEPGAKPEVYVLANETLLYRLFNHILENAQRHGFKNLSQSANRVVFQVFAPVLNDEINGELTIRMSNNGAPFPVNFDLTSLFRQNEFAGETGNTGRGGYEAKEIVGYFGGTISAGPSGHPDFPVEYSITLPIVAAEYPDHDVEDL